jgi:hypothetical protein
MSARGAFTAALAANALVLLACDPQIVDAVDEPAALPVCPDGGDVLQDSDGDGVPDCADACELDARKTVPGTCGCNLPDPLMLDEGEANCLDLQELLAHRYTFNGPSGSLSAVDSLAGKDGVIVGRGLSGNGTLDLAGEMSDEHVDLPNELVSGSESVTIEAWLRWRGGAAWQRLFDFGNNDEPEGGQGLGTSYLFLTPKSGNDDLRLSTGKIRLVYKAPSSPRELITEAPIALPSGSDKPTHIVAVVDAQAMTMSVYVNGKLQLGRAIYAGVLDYGTTPPTVVVPFELLSEAAPYTWQTPSDGGTPLPPVDLGAIVDENDWLGRSQYLADAELAATLYEFRIYAGALTEELVAISYDAGPDPVFLPEPESRGN